MRSATCRLWAGLRSQPAGAAAARGRRWVPCRAHAVPPVPWFWTSSLQNNVFEVIQFWYFVMAKTKFLDNVHIQSFLHWLRNYSNQYVSKLHKNKEERGLFNQQHNNCYVRKHAQRRGSGTTDRPSPARGAGPGRGDWLREAFAGTQLTVFSMSRFFP